MISLKMHRKQGKNSRGFTYILRKELVRGGGDKGNRHEKPFFQYSYLKQTTNQKYKIKVTGCIMNCVSRLVCMNQKYKIKVAGCIMYCVSRLVYTNQKYKIKVQGVS